MKTVITGSSGFLGSYVHTYFQSRGESIYTPNRADLQLLAYPKNSISRFIHIAGKAHSVPKTKQEEQEFFSINCELVKQICRQLENSQNIPKQFVFISTVSVYGIERGVKIDENHALQGKTPYAKSKIEAEKFLLQWSQKNHVQLLILRLPLISGNQAPGNLGKMMEAIKRGRYLRIGKGSARKSMVWAQDVAELIYREKEASGIYHLTDGNHPRFKELEEVIAEKWGVARIYSLPLMLAKFLGYIGDLFRFFPINSNTIKKITQDLTFDDSKAIKELNWKPQSVLQKLFTQ